MHPCTCDLVLHPAGASGIPGVAPEVPLSVWNLIQTWLPGGVFISEQKV